MAEKDQRSRTGQVEGEGGGGRSTRRKSSDGGSARPAKEPAKARGASGEKASGGREGKSPDLSKDLRDFASARPQGWHHDDWLHFLESLKNRGHDISDRDAIGIALEKERLDLALSQIKGMGPQRRRALVERYGTVWNLRNAEVDEIAGVAKVQRTLAEQVKGELS